MPQTIKGHVTIPVEGGKVTVYTDGTLVVAAPPPTLRGNEHHVVVMKLNDLQAIQISAALTELTAGLMEKRTEEPKGAKT
jgi:hypothetical protein